MDFAQVWPSTEHKLLQVIILSVLMLVFLCTIIIVHNTVAQGQSC